MIGSGMPRSQSSAPLPNPMFVSCAIKLQADEGDILKLALQALVPWYTGDAWRIRKFHQSSNGS
jgi:hypothetical protein